MTTCEGRTGYAPRPEGYGSTPIHCRQSVGLRAFRDATGRTRYACTRDGHRYSVVRRFGEWEPEQEDPITASKAYDDWTSGELVVGFGK